MSTRFEYQHNKRDFYLWVNTPPLSKNIEYVLENDVVTITLKSKDDKRLSIRLDTRYILNSIVHWRFIITDAIHKLRTHSKN
jgi:hypothetical protein